MRRVLPLIDLRTQAQRQGITNLQQTSQAIAGILQTLGAAEQIRRERQQLDTITRAIAGGATTIEAINTAVNQAKQTQFGTGIQGILQKIGGAFQPSPGGGIGQSIQQMIIGQRLKQALMPKFQIPSGLEPSSVTVGPEGGVTQRYAPPKAEKETKMAELIREGYSPEEARMILDISHGIKPRASARKQYENLGDVEKMDFLSKLKQRAEGQYYGVEGGNVEPRQPKLLKWVNEELKKLPMLSEGDYDYESAEKAGFGPNEKGHWDSQFKSDDSAERYVDGLDTKTASLNDVITTYTRLAREELGAEATPEQIVKKAKELAKSKGWKLE